jgi:hypothetical protein
MPDILGLFDIEAPRDLERVSDERREAVKTGDCRGMLLPRVFPAPSWVW